MAAKAGHVYAIANDAMPGLVKIGATTRDPIERLHEEPCSALYAAADRAEPTPVSRCGPPSRLVFCLPTAPRTFICLPFFWWGFLFFFFFFLSVLPSKPTGKGGSLFFSF